MHEVRSPLVFGRDVCGDLAAASAREWLVTNGVGGFASGTIDGSLTRSYHGLLVAALEPPARRVLLVAKFDETATYAGDAHELSTNRWSSGAVAPQGYRGLERFYLDGTTPVWEFAFSGALVEKRVTMELGANATLVRYNVLRADGPITFAVRAMIDDRDFHGATRGQGLPDIAERDGAIVARFRGGSSDIWLRATRGEAEIANEWYRDYDLPRERERGLTACEDHLHAATFRFTLRESETACVRAATSDVAVSGAARAFEERREREAALLNAWRGAQPRVSAEGPPEVAQLVLAADQFVVARPSRAMPDGRTLIAGYHWFGDWGRDTAIALPGLALVTGRPEIARSILLTFARYIDGGMLPNVFPDRGDAPAYNTVDAALWYVEAVRAYLEATNDAASLEVLYPAVAAIVAAYRSGTRYGIRMDAADALIAAGEPGVQLTWMDAKCGDWVVTPRIGKPVEINALWYNALRAAARIAARCGSESAEYDALAERVRAGFSRYALPDGAGLADVLDGPEGDDRSMRPNQIFAAALPHVALDDAGIKAVVAACGRELHTSHGLRTLAPGDPRYQASYDGPQTQRDAAYHQGTVWPWLLGPYACAYARAHGDAAAARALLDPLLQSLQAYGLGSIAEIAEGGAPFAWRGAIAQAWSVGETLRAYHYLSEGLAQVRP